MTTQPQASQRYLIGGALLHPRVTKRVAELRADPAVQARVDELAEKCNEGAITPEEMAEYDAYIQAMDVVAVLQKKGALIVQPHAS